MCQSAKSSSKSVTQFSILLLQFVPLHVSCTCNLPLVSRLPSLCPPFSACIKQTYQPFQFLPRWLHSQLNYIRRQNTLFMYSKTHHHLQRIVKQLDSINIQRRHYHLKLKNLRSKFSDAVDVFGIAAESLSANACGRFAAY